MDNLLQYQILKKLSQSLGLHRNAKSLFEKGSKLMAGFGVTDIAETANEVSKCRLLMQFFLMTLIAFSFSALKH